MFIHIYIERESERERERESMFFIGNLLLRIFALEGFVKARLAWLIPTKPIYI